MAAIEVFADVCCPFTHVGLRRFVQRRRRVDAPTPVLRMRSWPLELVNGEPLDRGLIAEEVDEIREQVAGDLFVGFDRDRFPATSLPAMALAEHAYALSDETGERVSLALRNAVFEEGVDVGDPAVLAAFASGEGLDLPSDDDHEAVRRSWQEGKDRGVVGSPHFFLPSGDYFCPSLDIARVDGHLRITADPAGFDAFLDDCLGG